MMRTILIALSVACLFAAAASAGDAKAGQAVYNRACKSCHGSDGTANPGLAKAMKVEIRNLGSSEVQAMSDEDMRKIIMDGKGKMKPVTSVSGADLDNLIAFVRTLKK
jgi:mono/diheme cytochrome c family protein